MALRNSTINEHRITNSEGRFQFSPVLGDFLIHLVPKREAFRADSTEFGKAIDPPPFVPVVLHLDKPGDKSIVLIEAPTATVSGVIRMNDGKPAAGMIVQLLIPPVGGNAYLDVGETKTDANGRYSIQAPIPLEHLIVTTNSQLGADGKRLRLQGVDPKAWSGGASLGCW